MFKFGKKNKVSKSSSIPQSENLAHSWHVSRYSSILIQRNILLFLTMLALCTVGVSVFVISNISKSRTIEPFVVEIEKKSGITTLVNPISVKQYSADEVLNNYFIIEYVRSRELFDPNNFQYNYYTKVRLLSDQTTYAEFRRWTRLSNPASPLNLYANVTSGILKIRSLQHLRPGNVQIRFSLEFNTPNGVVKKDRIATLSFQYATLEMNEQERQVNPLGFQITYYRADDEFL
ncbi:type IV secretion system protein [Ehrlichia ruminantium]|uniref:Bacterial virulence protein VirB8 domain-containing protein n=1 Tax=Ehrlichia ruminantium (strain Welgevonden) TaxID=254945 RepID=A0A0H3M057_EHRRW|nr:type IV secretion system protein [Ehrlichia ruminantium]KYW89036.1 type IV secretion system protein VirB8 [Ehrlichia ruminantium]QLK50105.1 type IV secretion system protein [Ehrlichia ruminantium]QLK51030.1 type IV secretion system protein [Ehrlichia ruminantium]QLK52864.1 type IV secretion system protein [Ehrlichia ruminantium]QLK54699.1 type IV secretion system protein [Ehrlichia ruminantium]